jgi:tetratricopeptide (TPR) repeat protein
MLKIAVYAIAKNEQHNVAEWLESVADADGVFVLDTGSKDKTIELLREGGATVNHMSGGKPFRFDLARNEAMNRVPEDFDVLVSLDFDERLSPDWRKVIEEQFDAETDCANYTLVYSFTDDGQILMSYPRMAVHRRNSATWQYAVHELLIPHQGALRKTLDMYAVHYGEAKPAGHYLDLLKTCHEERPNDPRPLGYLAREYYGMGNFQMAVPLYKRYVQIEQYPPVLSEACIRLAHMHTDFVSQEWWLRQAIQSCNDMREPYCEMALFYFRNEMWEHCVTAVKSAARIPRPDYNAIYRDEYYSDTWVYHMLMAAYQQDGNYRRALQMRDSLVHAYAGQPIPASATQDILILQNAVNEVYHAYRDCVRGTGSETAEQ